MVTFVVFLFVHPLNAVLCTVFKLSGVILIFFSFVQSLNAFLLIVLMFLPIVRLFSFLSPENALDTMLVTLSVTPPILTVAGIFTDAFVLVAAEGLKLASVLLVATKVPAEVEPLICIVHIILAIAGSGADAVLRCNHRYPGSQCVRHFLLWVIIM